MIIKNENTIVLCRRNKSCCPEISKITEGDHKGSFELKDDYEGRVILTKDQLDILKDVLDSNLID